ncbi:universal stress protein UspA [Loktanella sp. 5RATIMAR09]|uniref:universal stress protein n=1 Tax=Loktanella sp. 5RATIMAR09 TaxID=1225655 RepID=UPI0006EB7C5A|nr:universal stress protein [Loktanella sp. 5RATIMAR09]KQI73253.1 universal stress protein UspA [Loktanella sp. 5RATIMAR09]
MFRKIVVPIDLAHADRMESAITVAADLAKLYGATVCYLGATTPTPSSVAHSPEEYKEKLAAFALKEAQVHGQDVTTHVVLSHDPTATLDDDLVKEVDEMDVDLVVMATHVPHIGDRIWASNGGNLARRTKASVCLVRAAG